MSEVFCTTCEPTRRLAVEQGKAGHYAIAFGDAFKVKRLTVDGQDVTTAANACIVGVNGFVQVFIRPTQKCGVCAAGLLMQILNGNVQAEI